MIRGEAVGMREKDHKVWQVLRRIISLLFIVSAVWIWIIGFWSGVEKYHILFGAISLVCMAGVLWFGWLAGQKRRQMPDQRRGGPAVQGQRRVLAVAVPALIGFAGMLFVALAVRNDVVDNWDYGLVFQNAAAIATGRGASFDLDYFARYGNNALFLRLLAFFLGIIYRVTGREDIYFLLNCSIVFNCILVILSILLCSAAVTKVCSPREGLLTRILLLLMAPFYLYATFTYSDVYGLLPCAVVLLGIGKACANGKEGNRSVWTGLAAAAGVIAFLIKGTAVIYVLAGFFCVCFGKEFGEKRIRLLGIYIAAAAAAYFCLSLTNNLFLERYGVTAQLQEEKAFPADHFLMMAMNPETAGQYHYPDVEYTMSFPGKENKKKADREELAQRLRRMGAAGTLQHMFIKKAKYIYGTGTAGAPSYIVRKPLQENGAVRFFGGNKHFFAAALLYKLLLEGWIIAVSILHLVRKKEENALVLLAKISWIGMFLFFCIWESHPRYTFIFLPLIGILAAQYSGKR